MRSRQVYIFAACALLALCCACSSPQRPAATPTADGSAAVRAQMDRYNQAVAQMNADAVAALFAPTGQIFDTGQLQASGPEAVRTYLQNSYSAAHIDSYTPTSASVIVSVGVGVVSGTFDEKLTTTATNQASEEKGHYTVEWVLQSGGDWRIQRVSTDVVP